MKKILCFALVAMMLIYLAPSQVFVGYEMYSDAATAVSVPPPQEDYTRREPLPDSDNIRIGITGASFDDVGQILRYFGTGVDFFPLLPADFNSLDRLSQFYAIFINCGSHGSVNSRILNNYVYQGGVVYASDHAGSPLQEAFPDIFSYTSNTGSQTVRRAEIVHSTLAAHMGMTTLDVIFNLGGWYAVTELDERATVYIQGNAAETGLIPLAFSFNYGSGTVFYTSFHNSAQATMDMIDFIEYLVFRIKHIEIDRDMAERAERDGLHYRGQIFGRVQPGAESAPFAYTFDGDEFMLMLDEAQGNFSLNLTDPFGNVFRTNRQGEIIAFSPAPGQPAAASPAMELEALYGGGLRV
ncbi:MAG: hypothetical protein FWE92_06160, partial [Defluviitaleaceae bacterium]|nr:hypothetical protein [Defluviitaleaceae bacterium]